MNILFYTRFFPDPCFGGIERVTSVLASQFRSRYGCKVYCVVPQGQQQNKSHHFNHVFYVNGRYAEQQIRQIIEQCQIQIIISQYANDPLNATLAKVRQETKCRLITVYHFSPGCEMLSVREVLHDKSLIHGWKAWMKYGVKMLLGPIYLKTARQRINRAIQSAYVGSDRYVLLSDRFKEDFLKVYQITDEGSKISAIGNPLSFPVANVSFSETMAGKKKQVLIVARHSEVQKKIYAALQVWKIVEQQMSDWQLVLVGEGPDTERYKKYVCEHHLANVTFVGKQNPEAYYRESSIFMMTSRYEGFGVTLTEAQQMGVVPIAFDSYAALHDIIRHRENGLIVPNNDVEAYARELVQLMRDEEFRHVLAANGLMSCKKFAIEQIAAQWMELFRKTIMI